VEYLCFHYRHEQIQMWVTVIMVVLVICLVYVYLKKDIQVFSRPTIQDSVHHFKSKFYLRSVLDL